MDVGVEDTEDVLEVSVFDDKGLRSERTEAWRSRAEAKRECECESVRAKLVKGEAAVRATGAVSEKGEIKIREFTYHFDLGFKPKSQTTTRTRSKS